MPRGKKMAASVQVHTVQKRIGDLRKIGDCFEAYAASTRYREKYHKIGRNFRNYSKVRKCSNYPSLRKSRNRREYKLFKQMLWGYAIAMKIKKPNPTGYEYTFIGAFEAWLRHYLSRKDWRMPDVKLFKGECCRIYENESLERFKNSDIVQNCTVCNPTYSKFSFSENDTQILHLHHCYNGLTVEKKPDSEPDTETDSDTDIDGDKVSESGLSDSLLDEEATEV